MKKQFCCENIEKILHTFRWFYYEKDGVKTYTMACIDNFHLNYCPLCGKKIRGISISEEQYNNFSGQ